MGIDAPLRYFGEWWDAPAYDDAVLVETPVGVACMSCREPIEQGDSGNLMAYAELDGSTGGIVHLECWLRMGLGSVAHLTGRCSCSGVGEEPQGSLREQGRAVRAYVEDCKAKGIPLIGGGA
jgi:hypothetical protein